MPRIEDFEKRLTEALWKIGFIIEGKAKELCPVDTGRLRASIGTTVEDNEVHVGTNVDYAKYVELGTRRMNAEPFLRPAIFLSKDRIVGVMKEVL